ncbi:hypothetical protein KI387_007961, partial [Taxus chinensis]
RGSGESAENGTKGPFGTWDSSGQKVQSTRLGRFGRKWNRVHFKFELEKFGQKVPKYATRPVWAKLEQSALLKLGHLGQESAKYAVR